MPDLHPLVTRVRALPDYAVIGDVSQILESVLTDALGTLQPAPPPIARIHDLTNITPNGTPAVLSIFLFEVVEDASVRNRPWERTHVGSQVLLRKPPMPLLLRYLLTPWAVDPVTQHRMLGRVMQVLYDGAILSGPTLRGGLANTNQALKLKMAPLTLEERSRIWYSIQRPYRLSQTYEVRVVNLDPESQESRRPVRSRRLDPATAMDLPDSVDVLPPGMLEGA